MAFYASLDDDQSTIDSTAEMDNVATPSSESTASVDTEAGSEDTIENDNVGSGKTKKTTVSVIKEAEAAEKRVEEAAKEMWPLEVEESKSEAMGIDVNSWADPELAVSEEAYQDFEDDWKELYIRETRAQYLKANNKNYPITPEQEEQMIATYNRQAQQIIMMNDDPKVIADKLSKLPASVKKSVLGGN